MEYRQRIYNQYVASRSKASAMELSKELTLRASYFLAIIKRYFPSDKEIAITDLGCGYGGLVYYARQQGYRNVIGVDGSKEQVDAARDLNIHQIQQSDLFAFLQGIPRHSQDFVVSLDVIEHFTKNELIELVDHVFSALKEGGRWLIHAPNAESPFFGRILYGDFSHELAFTQHSIAQLLHASGFRSVESFEDMPAVHGIVSGIRLLFWKLIRECLRFYLRIEIGHGNSIVSQNFYTVAIK